MSASKILNLPNRLKHTGRNEVGTPHILDHPAQDAAVKTILEDPIVIAKMKDFITKNTSWTPASDSMLLAGQVELAREVLGDRFDEDVKKQFPSQSQYHAFRKSHQYPSQRRYGIKQLEKKNGFAGFDDEETAHFTPLAISSGLIDPNASFDDDNYAHFLPLDILKGGVKLVKGAAKKIADKKALNKANANTVAGLQNQVTPSVDTAIQKVGKRVANVIKEKKKSADQMIDNNNAAAILSAKNSAIAAGAPAEIVNSTSDLGALNAMSTAYNQKNGGNVVAPVTTTSAPAGTAAPAPMSTDISPLMIGGSILVLAVVIYFATR